MASQTTIYVVNNQKSTVCLGYPSRKQMSLEADLARNLSRLAPMQPGWVQSRVFSMQTFLPAARLSSCGLEGYFAHSVVQPSLIWLAGVPKMLSQVVYLPGYSPQSSTMKSLAGWSRMYRLPLTWRQKQLAGALTVTLKPLFFKALMVLSREFLAAYLWLASGRYFQSTMMFLWVILLRTWPIWSATLASTLLQSCASPKILMQVRGRWQLAENPQMCGFIRAQRASIGPMGWRQVPQTIDLPQPKFY